MTARSLSPSALRYAALYFVVCGVAAAGVSFYFYDSLIRAGFMGAGTGIGMALVFLWTDWTGQGPLG
ncbi:hypothetical protein U3A55_10580 [Salarchaeum sp. III]|uniref:hypothetical protein n=1 Tax=Salarchaeum sp. III TaxID=3107927 RepID=UPI002ED83ABF